MPDLNTPTSLDAERLARHELSLEDQFFYEQVRREWQASQPAYDPTPAPVTLEAENEFRQNAVAGRLDNELSEELYRRSLREYAQSNANGLRADESRFLQTAEARESASNPARQSGNASAAGAGLGGQVSATELMAAGGAILTNALLPLNQAVYGPLADSFQSAIQNRSLQEINPFHADSALHPQNYFDETFTAQVGQSFQNLRGLARQAFDPLSPSTGLLLDMLEGLQNGILPDGMVAGDLAGQLETLIDQAMEDSGIEAGDDSTDEEDEGDSGGDEDGVAVPNPNAPTFPPAPGTPAQPGYYKVDVVFDVYGAKRVNTGELSGGQQIYYYAAEPIGGQISHTEERVANPSIQYDYNVIGIPHAENRLWSSTWGVFLFERGVQRKTLRTQQPLNPPAPTVLPSRVELYVPVRVDYTFLEGPDWFPQDDPHAGECLAPLYMPDVKKDVESLVSAIDALDTKLSSISQSLFQRLDRLEQFVLNGHSGLFTAIKAVNNDKIALQHDNRMQQILEGQSSLTQTLSDQINDISLSSDSPIDVDFEPLKGEILAELGLTKQDIIDNQNLSLTEVLNKVQSAQDDVLSNQATSFNAIAAKDDANTQTILNAFNDIDFTPIKTDLPTLSDIDSKLAAQTSALMTDHDDTKDEILGALFDEETGELNVTFPDDLTRVPDLDAQTTAINTATATEVQTVQDTIGTVGEEDARTAMEMLREIAGPAAVVGSIAYLGTQIVNTTTIVNTVGTNLNEVLLRLGPKLEGGLSGIATKTNTLLKKTWNFLQVDRVLNFLNYVTNLHNAYMLSADITQTLFGVVDNVLNLLGLEDADGNPLSVGEMVSSWLDTFAKALFGVETLEGIKAQWAKLNRIYQAAMNIIYTVQSIVDSLRSILEIIGEYVARIGNALKRSGTIMENSFGWMQERFDKLSVQSARWEKMFSRIEDIEEVASSMEMVTAEMVSIKDNVDQLRSDRQELGAAIAEYGNLNNDGTNDRGATAESVSVRTAEESDKAASQAPDLLETAQIGFPDED